MAERTWYVAGADGPQGPFSDAEMQRRIVAGMVSRDTPVRTGGMAQWQKAGDVPGLIPASVDGPAGPLPPVLPGAPPRPGEPPSGGALEATFGVWPLFGRSLLCVLLFLLVIPAPWAVTRYFRWLAAHIRVPGRGVLAFTGRPGDIWYVIVLSALCGYAGTTKTEFLPVFASVLNVFLTWQILRWFIRNLAAPGPALSLRFSGGAWAYLGWHLLLGLAFITIVGWAWVQTAWMRWVARRIEGTRRPVTFTGTGWGLLWRSLLVGLSAVLIIPIPWTTHWLARWFCARFALRVQTI
jgi:hypothetical protein